MNAVSPACSVQIALCDLIWTQEQKKLCAWLFGAQTLTSSLKHWFKMSGQLWNWCVAGNDIKQNENTLKVVRNKEIDGTELANTEGASTHAQPWSSQAGWGSCYHGTDDQLSLRGQRSPVCVTDRFFIFIFSCCCLAWTTCGWRARSVFFTIKAWWSPLYFIFQDLLLQVKPAGGAALSVTADCSVCSVRQLLFWWFGRKINRINSSLSWSKSPCFLFFLSWNVFALLRRAVRVRKASPPLALPASLSASLSLSLSKLWRLLRVLGAFWICWFGVWKLSAREKTEKQRKKKGKRKKGRKERGGKKTFPRTPDRENDPAGGPAAAPVKHVSHKVWGCFSCRLVQDGFAVWCLLWKLLRDSLWVFLCFCLPFVRHPQSGSTAASVERLLVSWVFSSDGRAVNEENHVCFSLSWVLLWKMSRSVSMMLLSADVCTCLWW